MRAAVVLLLVASGASAAEPVPRIEEIAREICAISAITQQNCMALAKGDMSDTIKQMCADVDKTIKQYHCYPPPLLPPEYPR